MQGHLEDKRGKRHDLAFVLTGLLVALLQSSSKLDVSALHRSLVRGHGQLVQDTGHCSQKPISDAQLRRLLSGLDHEAYNRVNQDYFGVAPGLGAGSWQAVDGKELRGTIDGVMGQKRGQSVVRLVSHHRLESRIVGYYQGDKESEKTVVEEHFQAQPQLGGQGYSFDALHTSSALLTRIEQRQGLYLAQVKQNQKKLLEECRHVARHLPALATEERVEKAHGCIERRQGCLYALDVAALEERWRESGLRSLAVLTRKRERVRDGQQSVEVSYYVSNLAPQAGQTAALLGAVRGHWGIEADNWVRDVTFGKDKIRCRDSGRIRALSGLINIALNLIRRHDPAGNVKALREVLNADRSKVVAYFSHS